MPSAALIVVFGLGLFPVVAAVATRLRVLGAVYLAAQHRLTAVVDGYLNRLKPACVHRTVSAEQDRLVRVVGDLLRVHARVVGLSSLSSALVPFLATCTVTVLLAVSHSVFAVPVLRLGVIAVVVLRIVPSLHVLADALPRVAMLVPEYAYLADLRRRLATAARPDPFALPASLPHPPELYVSAAAFVHPGGAAVPPAGWDARAAPGSLLLLSGPSGAGKTTCLDLVAGLLEPAVGSLTLDGAPPSRYPGVVGYLPQSVSPVPAMLRDHLAWAGAVVDPSAARCLLERLGLAPGTGTGWLDARIGPGGRELSGGEWSRLHLAGVVLARPRLLVLDEPTANLDPDSARRVIAVVCACRPEATVVVASHDPAWRAVADIVVDLPAPHSSPPAAAPADSG